MKGVARYVTGGAVVVLLVMIVYLLSFPVAMWATGKGWPAVSTRNVVRFYMPALALAGKCPPYRAVLDYENRLFGLGPVYIHARRGTVK